jgi:hypothetical protein
MPISVSHGDAQALVALEIDRMSSIECGARFFVPIDTIRLALIVGIQRFSTKGLAKPQI